MAKHVVVSLSGGMDSSTLLLRCLKEYDSVTALSFDSVPGAAAQTRVLYMGSGTWDITDYWDVNSDGFASDLTIYPETSTLILRNSTNTTNFVGGGKNYYNVQFSMENFTGHYIYGSNTFNNISVINPAVGGSYLYFQAGTTQTFNNITLSGTAGNLIYVQSNTSGTLANFYNSSTVANLSYLSIQDMFVSPASTWKALRSNGNVNNGNNYGWIFSLPHGSMQFFT